MTAEDVVRLFEVDASARRRLAELLVSEPEVRLAILNAVLREVATKSDLEKLREEFKAEIEKLRGEFRREIDEIREDIRELRGELQELRNRLWWVTATVILGWLVVAIEQFLLLHLAR